MRPARVFCLCLLVVAVSCAPRAPLPSYEPPELHERLRRDVEMVRSYRAVGRFLYEDGNHSVPGQLFVVARSPDLLRIEVVGSFGRPLFVLVHDGGRLCGLDSARGLFYTGSSSRENLAAFFPIPLSIREVFTLLAGRIDPGDAAPVPVKNWWGKTAFRLAGGGELTLGGAGYLLKDYMRETAGRAGKVQVKLTGEIAGGDFIAPEKIVFRMGDEVISIRYTGFAVNVDVSDEPFRMEQPPGVGRFDLDSGREGS